MPDRNARLLLTLTLAALLSNVACDDDGGSVRLNALVPFSPSAPLIVSRMLSVPSSLIRAQPVPSALCPFQPPLIAPINLTFRSDLVTSLVFSGVQMRLVDRTGIRAGSLILTQPDLVTRFGSTIIPAFGARTFPLAFPFGCDGLRAGTVTIVVFVADPFGLESSGTITVDVQG